MKDKNVGYEELLKELVTFEKVYDLIRIVDPKNKSVLFARDGKGSRPLEMNQSCFSIWKRNEICSNCISMRAHNENDTFVKVEMDGEQIIMVTAIPLIAGDSMVTVELIKNITGSMIPTELGIAANSEIRRLLDKANMAAVTDELTGVFNKRHIMERLPVDIIMSGINREVFSILITDIDFFKRVNDIYGHLAGDLVLKEFARILKENVRNDKDWIGRFGGEEFVICLAGTSAEDAFAIGERIRKYVQNHDFCYKDKIINITASFGLCTSDESSSDYEELLKCADEKLYMAKRSGRNKIVI